MKSLFTSLSENKGRILFVKGYSQYNVLRVAADQTMQGFLSKGYDVDVIDCSDDSDIKIIMSKVRGDYVFIFSLQAYQFLLTENNISIFEYTKIPNIGWIFDDVFYHWQRIEKLCYDNAYIISIDSFARQHLTEGSRIYYMPHGAIKYGDSKCYHEKDYDILFPASLGEYPDKNIYFSDSLSNYLSDNCILEIKNNPNLSVRAALANVFNNLDKELTPKLQRYFASVILYVTEYIRVYFREQLLKSLASSGYMVHVIGVNRSNERYPENVTFHGAADIEDVVDMMKRTKILINPIPNVYEGGLHERLLTGMLYDCIIYSPYTEYLHEVIGSRIEYIDLNNLNDFTNSVGRSIDEFDKYDKFEDNRRYAAENTFEKRGEQIIDLIEKEILYKE